MSSAEPGAGGRLLVLSDSLAYYGPEGGLPANDARIWPNLVGAREGLAVDMFGRVGWTSRDIWWAVTQDPNIWAALGAAEVVVLGVGGMDSLPSPLPTALREQIRYLRPTFVRQAVRTGYQWLQPRLSPAGWPMALPPRITVDHLEKVRAAIGQLRPDLPILVLLPPTHRSPYYGYAHPGWAATTTAMRAWADDHRVAVVDLADITTAAFEGSGVGDAVMNADGIHWGFACHRAVADRVGDAVRSVRG